jgi:hypothetical protein
MAERLNRLKLPIKPIILANPDGSLDIFFSFNGPALRSARETFFEGVSDLA